MSISDNKENDKIEIKDKRRTFTMVDDLIVDDEELSWKAKVVYLVLANYSDNTSGECWPSVKSITKKAGTSRSSVEKGLKELADKDYILRKKRFRENGSQTSSLYILIDLYNHQRNKEVYSKSGGCISKKEGVHSNEVGGASHKSTKELDLKELDSNKLFNNNNKGEDWNKLAEQFKVMLSADKLQDYHIQQIDKLYSFTDKLDLDLILKKMKDTALAPRPSVKYCINGLNKFIDEDITSIEDLQRKKEKSCDKKEKKKAERGANDEKQRVKLNYIS